MLHCNRCGVDVSGDWSRCPLCRGELTGAPEPSPFPVNAAVRRGRVAGPVLAFISGALVLVMVFLGLLLSLPWRVIVLACLAIVANWLFVRNAILHRPDALRVTVRYFLVLVALAFAWFLLTKSLIVTTFVIPGICLVALVFDTVLLAATRATFVSGYAKYLLADVACGLAPLVLDALGLVTWRPLALMSALAAALFLLGLIAFLHRDLAAELRKLFSA